MIMDLGCFKNEVICFIENNSKNDDFSFDVRARNGDECLVLVRQIG